MSGFQALLGGTLFCLEATHVHWHSHGGPSTVANGLALTPTLHKLFDHGAWSLDDNRRVIVSRHFSGSDVALGELRALEGRPLRAQLAERHIRAAELDRHDHAAAVVERPGAA